MKKKIVTLIISIVLLGIAASLVGLRLVGVVAQWRQLEERLGLLDAAIYERETLLTKADEITAATTGREDVRRLGALFPRDQELPTLIALVGGLASARGVILEEITFPQTESGSVTFAAAQPRAAPYQTFKINLTASASYQSLKSFLGALDGAPRLIDTRRFSIVPEERGGLVKFQALLNAYYQAR